MSKSSDSVDGGSLKNIKQEEGGSTDDRDRKAAQHVRNRDTGHCTCYNDDVNANIQRVGLCQFCKQNQPAYDTSRAPDNTTMK